MKKLPPALFIALWALFMMNDMFAAGVMVGKFGNDALIYTSAIEALLAVFYTGYFLGKYRNQNPL